MAVRESEMPDSRKTGEVSRRDTLGLLAVGAATLSASEAFAANAPAHGPRHVLWYRKPATNGRN
jgi:hypothetical protein